MNASRKSRTDRPTEYLDYDLMLGCLTMSPGLIEVIFYTNINGLVKHKVHYLNKTLTWKAVMLLLPAFVSFQSASKLPAGRKNVLVKQNEGVGPQSRILVTCFPWRCYTCASNGSTGGKGWVMLFITHK